MQKYENEGTQLYFYTEYIDVVNSIFFFSLHGITLLMNSDYMLKTVFLHAWQLCYSFLSVNKYVDIALQLHHICHCIMTWSFAQKFWGNRCQVMFSDKYSPKGKKIIKVTKILINVSSWQRLKEKLLANSLAL